jgi:hypothetical protein
VIHEDQLKPFCGIYFWMLKVSICGSDQSHVIESFEVAVAVNVSDQCLLCEQRMMAFLDMPVVHGF